MQAARLQSQLEQTSTRLEDCHAQLQTAQANLLVWEQKANMLETKLEEVRANLGEVQQRLLQAQAEKQQSGVSFAYVEQNRSRAEFQADNERLLRIRAEAQIAQVRAEATAVKTALLEAEWSIKARDARGYKMDQEIMSMRAQKQILEQQMYEIQTRNKVLNTEYHALHQGFETATVEVARGNQRISVMEDREKQLATLLKQLQEEHQSHVACLQLQIKEHERTIAQKHAVALAALADNNQIHSMMTQMSDFLQLSHQQLKTVQQQQKTQQESMQIMSMYATMPTRNVSLAALASNGLGSKGSLSAKQLRLTLNNQSK